MAFHSRKFNPAELNYEIYDKEMLAIVDSLEHYRHYFEGLGHRVMIYSDHQNLLWFTETKVYNRRQARWAEKLSKFDFVITFRPGRQGGKPDALSRRPDYVAENSADKAKPMTFLKPTQIDTTGIDPTYSLNSMVLKSIGVNTGLQRDILAALPEDPEVSPYLEHLNNPTLSRNAELPENFSMDPNGLLLKEGLVYVPAVDAIKLQILQDCHDGRTAGHLGQEKTLELVSRDYIWPGMRRFVKEYVRTCDTCARNKTPRHRRHGQLHPLPIPGGPWKSVSMDFIVELPMSRGYDAIYVCVDRFTKMAHFCPTNSDVTAEGTADLYLRHVFKNHGLPNDIVSDRGPQFISKFTRRLLELCEIKGNRSTAYHPQSDGQTERMNQTLEQYLRIYCSYHQDDWSQLLPLAEFVYNNSKNVSTGASPFYANYGYHPRANLKVQLSTGVGNPAAEDLANRLRNVHKSLRSQLEAAQKTYKKKFDRHTKITPTFKPGDQVWLIRKNIKTTRPSQKFDTKRLGPFKILEVVGEAKAACKLDLPHQMRIHPVFHESLLEPYYANKIEGRLQPPPPPPEVIEGEMEYEVKEILDSRIVRGKLKYLVDWLGYSPEERTWEPAEHLTHAPEAIMAFHRDHPQRPSQSDIQKRPRRSSEPEKGGTVTNARSSDRRTDNRTRV